MNIMTVANFIAATCERVSTGWWILTDLRSISNRRQAWRSWAVGRCAIAAAGDRGRPAVSLRVSRWRRAIRWSPGMAPTDESLLDDDHVFAAAALTVVPIVLLGEADHLRLGRAR